MRVDANISDLFFNTDISDARLLDAKGNFVGFNEEAMLGVAEDTLGCLSRLGVAVPSPRELVDDFYKRV